MQSIKVYRPMSDEYPISASFGAINPSLWPEGPHRGTDFCCPKGSDVLCAYDGHVHGIFSNHKTLGNYILILSQEANKSKFIHRYSHLSTIFLDVTEPKELIKAGRLIAFSGDSGRVFGAHLDFALKSWPAWAPIKPEFYANHTTERTCA